MNEKQNTKRLNIFSHEGTETRRRTMKLAIVFSGKSNSKFYFSLCLCVFVREYVPFCVFYLGCWTFLVGYWIFVFSP